MNRHSKIFMWRKMKAVSSCWMEHSWTIPLSLNCTFYLGPQASILSWISCRNQGRKLFPYASLHAKHLLQSPAALGISVSETWDRGRKQLYETDDPIKPETQETWKKWKQMNLEYSISNTLLKTELQLEVVHNSSSPHALRFEDCVRSSGYMQIW